MSSFDTVDFKVIAQNGRWPLPEPDTDGLYHYKATVRLETEADYKALQGMHERITVKAASGMKGGTVVIETGGDSADLLVPVKKGSAGTFDAILIGFNPQIRARTDESFDADCDWIILGDPTP